MNAKPVHALAGSALLGLLAALALWVTLLLGGNPGWFSHDELQWGARSQVEPWASIVAAQFTATDAFQYRPLTFSLWSLMASLLFGHPLAMHVLWLLLGACNTLMLARLLQSLGVERRVVAAAALLFWLTPYAVYVHGWTATLADLLWAGTGLGLGLLATQPREVAARTATAVGLLALVLAAAALLAKEAAVVLAPLAWLGWWLLGTRRSASVAIGISIAVGIWLAWRAAGLLDAAPVGSGYGWSLANVPDRLLRYHVFPFFPGKFEVHTLFKPSVMRHFATAATILVLYLVALGGPRRALFALLAGSAALGPVLILNSSANQYGYGLALVQCVVLALAWGRSGAAARTAIVLLALLSCWHGVQVASEIRRVGSLQATFSPSLVERVHESSALVLELVPGCPGDGWVYQRLLAGVPAYHGTVLTGRVQLLQAPRPGVHVIACNGRVGPAGDR